jgi:hypothetical protein
MVKGRLSAVIYETTSGCPGEEGVNVGGGTLMVTERSVTGPCDESQERNKEKKKRGRERERLGLAGWQYP